MSHSEPVPSKRAIFLSYASEDAAAVQRIAEALRSAGIEAWLDQDELGVGDTWDLKIRSQIKSCRLFMPVISAATQARTEGYFRREWKLAVERTFDMADHIPFLLPVVIDGTRDLEARVPDKFREVQWTRLPGGETSAAFCARLNQLLAGEEPAPPAPRTASIARAKGNDNPAGNPLDQPSHSPPGAKPDQEASPPVPDYELLRRIGRGSYGDVWLARGITGIYRAVKVVWRDRFENADPFEREFRGLRDFAAISLQAKGQMALLHIGRNDALGFFYYVMELADDASTGRAFDPATYVPLTLKEWRRRKGRVPASEVVTAGVELATSLAALHASGLVHRDIKPSNVILVNGQAKLADIGLVADAHEAHTFIGTVGYVPPEGPGSPAADVYALGCVLYELATGLDLGEFPQLPPELSRLRDHRLLLALNPIILRACEADPRRRYPAATALLDDLLPLQSGGAGDRRVTWRRTLAASVLVGLALGLGLWWKFHSGPPAVAASPAAPAAAVATSAANPTTVAEKSIAVLAFVNLSDDKDNEYFSDGVSEELLNALATVPGLKVMARTSSFFFKDKNVPVSEIARQLKVSYVVEGSVRKSGSRVRITAELVKAADGFRVWSKSFDRELKDIFALQDELAGVIVGQLRTPLFGLTGSLPTTDRPVAPTKNLAAYELSWRGRFEFNKKSPEGINRSIDLYEQAVRLDPDFALAWAQLATARSWAVYLYGADRATYLPAMQKEAARAAELAPDSADTQVALSEVAMANWEWKAARQASDSAVALAPSDSDVLQMASFVALACGDNEAVERFARRALERDPFNVGAFLNLGLARIAAGDFTAAENIARQTITLAPSMDWGYFNLMEVCLRQHRPDEAAACVPNLDGFRQMIAPALVAQARGRRPEADAELKHLLTETKIPESNPYLIAEVYGFRGDADEAFLWLDRAYAVHSQLFCILLTDNLLQGLHKDPRWRLLLEKLGLTDEQLR
jgi:TolB-like protein/tetratricopeptide (TPR) repeat protein